MALESVLCWIAYYGVVFKLDAEDADISFVELASVGQRPTKWKDEHGLIEPKSVRLSAELVSTSTNNYLDASTL